MEKQRSPTEMLKNQDEFQKSEESLRKFFEAKSTVEDDIRKIKHELKSSQLYSRSLSTELKEAKGLSSKLHFDSDQIHKSLIQLAAFKSDIPVLRSRYDALHSTLVTQMENNHHRLEQNQMSLEKKRDEQLAEYNLKIKEKEQQVNSELSSLQSQLALENDEQVLKELEIKHANELDLLRETITFELEQEKATAHNNCRSKARGLMKQIQELEEKINELRNSNQQK